MIPQCVVTVIKCGLSDESITFLQFYLIITKIIFHFFLSPCFCRWYHRKLNLRLFHIFQYKLSIHWTWNWIEWMRKSMWSLLLPCSGTFQFLICWNILFKIFYRTSDQRSIFGWKKIKFLPLFNLFLLIALTIALIATTKRNQSEMAFRP